MSVLTKFIDARVRQQQLADMRKNALSTPEIQAALEKVRDKMLVFSVSSGRAGTMTLCQLFNNLDQVCATHEPEPGFDRFMRYALSEPAVASAFLVRHKLPTIAAVREPIYVETSCIFAKAYLPAMLSLGLRPRLIMTKRSPRKIAKSFERIMATPYRTSLGRIHLISPADPSFLPIVRWDDFTDYQLCYWYALETQQRQDVLRRYAEAQDCICVDIKTDDLSSPIEFTKMFDALRFGRSLTPYETARLEKAVGIKHNLLTHIPAKAKTAGEMSLEDQESMVLVRVQEVTPDFMLAL